jgi:hypothetical protein
MSSQLHDSSAPQLSSFSQDVWHCGVLSHAQLSSHAQLVTGTSHPQLLAPVSHPQLLRNQPSQLHELAAVSQAHELAAVSHAHDVSHGHDSTFLQSASHVVRPPSGVTPPYSSHPAPASHSQLVVFLSQAAWHDAELTTSAPEQKLSSASEQGWFTLHWLGTFCALRSIRRAFRDRAAAAAAAARRSSAATAVVSVCCALMSTDTDCNMRFRSSTEAYIVLAWAATASPSEATTQSQNSMYSV